VGEQERIPRPWFAAQSMATTMDFLKSRSRELRETPEGCRRLGWFILPPFQRPLVWTEAQKVRFVESCWNGLPIGVFVWNEAYGTRYDQWLLDGQQRISAVLGYMADKFPVFGYRFSELTEVDLRRWDMGVQFPCLKTHITDEDKLRDVYDRLAYGGTPHDPKAPTND